MRKHARHRIQFETLFESKENGALIFRRAMTIDRVKYKAGDVFNWDQAPERFPRNPKDFFFIFVSHGLEDVMTGWKPNGWSPREKPRHPMNMTTSTMINSGQIITLRLSSNFKSVTFWHGYKKLFGIFEFVPNEDRTKYQLETMYVPLPRQGLGERALKLFIAYTKAKVCARKKDYPEFIERMQSKGLIELG